MDAIDGFAWLYVVALMIGAPVAGWVLMGLDYRTYLRSLRRAMVTVRHYALGLPDWAQDDRPACFVDLGITPPCTRDEVLAAYRRRVKQLHPDVGGDRKRFEVLQRHFEEAMAIVS